MIEASCALLLTIVIPKSGLGYSLFHHARLERKWTSKIEGRSFNHDSSQTDIRTRADDPTV